MATATPLIVLLGAGASAASGNYHSNGLRPPLTVDLFDESLYRESLQKYDLAHQAGRHINRERAADDSLALEHVLHGLRASDHPHHQRMAVAVPPYLQELLHTISLSRYADAFRYDHLIERLLRLPYVLFLTLNYDLLLDRRLHSHHRITEMDDYITGSDRWALIKLHGSVNWFYSAKSRFEMVAPPVNPDWDPLDVGCEPPDSSLKQIRGGSVLLTNRYPALAMPEGPDDRLVLPSRHLWFCKQKLEAAQQADLLVIGYSGLDSEALKLLASRDCAIRRMTVVNTDLFAATQVMSRFQAAGVEPLWPDIRSEDFASWADGAGLNQLVEEYDGPYGPN